MFIEAYSHNGELSNLALDSFNTLIKKYKIKGRWATLHVKETNGNYRVFVLIKDRHDHEFKETRLADSIPIAVGLCLEKISEKFKTISNKELSNERCIRLRA